MEKTCTLCHFTTHSDFSWESHLARDEHRVKKMQADNAALIEALKLAVQWLDNMRRDPRAISSLVDNAPNDNTGIETLRIALAQAEG